MKTVSKKEARIKAGRKMIKALRDRGSKQETRLALIQMLVPVGLMRAEEELRLEAEQLAGRRYARGKENGWWGSNPGYVYLGDQKVTVEVPRVRNRRTNREVSLSSYEGLQNPTVIDELMLNRVLKGLSERKYEEAAIRTGATFGINKSSVSRRFVRATGRKLREFLERDLSDYDFVAIMMDGKSYAGSQIVVAMGITMEGEKVLLGFTEAATENYQICKDFLNRLINRGLKTEEEILFVLDGAKGLRKGVRELFGEQAFVQRCIWHKRENVIRYLDRDKQEYFRRKLQAAYEQTSYEAAKRRLEAIRRELRPINESAVASLDEGLEETLTLHRLGVFAKVGISLKTTNCLENVNRHLERYTGRVDRWRTSDQRRRWVASALIDIEPRLRKTKGWEFLPVLREAMRDERLELSGRKLLRAA